MTPGKRAASMALWARVEAACCGRQGRHAGTWRSPSGWAWPGTALILLQAGLLARLLAGAARGTGVAALAGALAWLGVVVAGRAVAAAGGEAAALRAAAVVKSRLRRRLAARAWSWARDGSRPAGRGAHHPDHARAGRARRLRRALPAAARAGRARADRRAGRRRGRRLALGADHRADPAADPLFWPSSAGRPRPTPASSGGCWPGSAGTSSTGVEGLPTLRSSGGPGPRPRGRRSGEAHREATMRTLRIAFLSALVLELPATLSVALVAVQIGIRLLAARSAIRPRCWCCSSRRRPTCRCATVGARFHAAWRGWRPPAVFDHPRAARPLPPGRPGDHRREPDAPVSHALRGCDASPTPGAPRRR